ncbi:hypothetical protein, partial [Lacisediminimonas sp.]|uniref:hypothetical protein n=1 Tax=Lacisediminimonas sp. TaxID=3060582 RepID=UPI00271950FE
MVAFVSGNALGLEGYALRLPGQQADPAALGQAGLRALVNTHTGNLVLQRQDEILLGRGPDVAILRTYNSQGQLDDDNADNADNADNWRIGLYRSIGELAGAINASGSTLRRTDGDGAEQVYTWDAARNLYRSTARAGSQHTLTHDAAANDGNGAWTWTDGVTGASETYDWSGASGKLLRVADRDGNALTYAYAGNVLASVTSASGEQTLFDYTGTLLTQVRTVSNTGVSTIRTRYAYDAHARLAKVSTDLSPQDGSIADGRVFGSSYTYDDSNGRSNRVASVTQSDGIDLHFTYTLVGDTWRVATIGDALGRVTRLAWDMVDGQSRTTITDPAGMQTVTSTDSLGRLTSMQGPPVAGQPQALTWTYNDAGDLQSTVDARGNTTRYDYDASGNQLRVRQQDAAGRAIGNLITRVFDADNRLVVETISGARADGIDPAVDGTPPASTRHAWDSRGHLRFSVSAAGRVTEHRYNALGQRVSSIDHAGARYDVQALASDAAIAESVLASWVANGIADQTRSMRTDTTYDFRGQVASVTTYSTLDAAGNGLVNGTQATTHYIHDAAGKLLSTVAPKGVATTTISSDYVTTFANDGLGRLTLSRDSLGRTTITAYDNANRRVITTMANGLVTTSAFNRAGELVSVLQSDSASATGTTAYQYDDAGRLRMRSDPTGVRSWTLYDEAGRKVADIDHDGSLVETVHDAGGQVVRRIAYATALTATVLASLADASGQPASVTLASLRPGASASDRSTWQLYDHTNRLARSIDADGFVTSNVRDAAGRIIETIRHATALPATIIAAITTDTAHDDPALAPPAHPDDRHTRHFFDADGLAIATLDAAGYLVENDYDSAGRLVHTVRHAVQTEGARRSTGTLAQLRPGEHASDIHEWLYYDSRGKQVGSVDGEGYLSESIYDLHGNLTRQVRYANKAVVAPLSMMASMLPGALRPVASMYDQTSTQTFSSENQLQSATDYQGTVTRFSYDAANNVVRTDKAWGTSEVRTLQARYDRQGRLLGELSAEGSAQLASVSMPTSAQVDAIWASYGLRHTVDAAGRRTSTTDANGLRTLFYFNTDGQLTHTINEMGELVEQRTDALGQVTHTIRYGYRIAAATLATLTGGLVDARLLAAIDAIRDSEADSVEQVVYTRRGHVAATIDAMGAARSNSYNAFGELVSQQFPAIPASAGDGSEPTSGNEYGSDYSYDQRGLLVQSRQGGGSIERATTIVHDAFGRAILTVDANGNHRSASHDRLGREVRIADSADAVRSTTWDAFGRTLTQTDALGNITQTRYGTGFDRSTVVTTAEGITVISQANRHGQVISVNDGSSYLGSRNTYDRNGNLVKSTDAAGNVLVNDYDHADRLLQTTDARGVRTTFMYDAANRVLVRTLDPGGLNLSTQYAWDAKGQVLRMTDANGVVTATSYDLKGRVVQVAVDPDGLNLRTFYTFDQRDQTLSVTEGAGTDAARVTRYAYDRLGRRIAETVDPAGLALTTSTEWDRNDNLVSRTDANGCVTRYFHDAQDKLVYTLDPMGGVTHNVHDLNGRLIKVVAYARPLDDMPASTTTADIGARLLANASPSDRVTHMVRDRDGRIVHEIDSLNQATTSEFDNSGNVIRRTVRARTVTLPATLTVSSVNNAIYGSAADRVTRTVYNAINRAVFTIDAMGGVTQNEHDAAGHVVRSVAYANPIYLGYNPVMEEVIAALVPDAARDQVTRTVFDAAGRAVFSIDGMGHVKETRYDALGLIVSTVDHPQPVSLEGTPGLAAVRAALSATAASSDPASGVAPARINTYDYDSAGRLVVSIDPAGHVEKTTWDALGNKTSFTNKLGAQWTYAYDAAARLVSETSPEVAVTTVSDSLVATTEHVALQTRLARDALGNLVARTEAWGRAEQRTTRYEYDALGRQVRVIHPQLNIYDAAADNLWKNGLDGIVKRTETGITPTTTVSYDRFGNATVNRDAAGNTSYRVYDRLGRIQYAIDTERSVTEYAYNVQGQQIRLTRHVEQISMAGHPDVAAPFTAAEIAALLGTSAGDRSILTDYDLAGRATRITEPLVDAYDSSAAAASQYFTAGKTTRNTYDAFGRITQQSTLRNPRTGTWAHTLSWYDMLGNKVAQVDPMGYLSIWEHDASGNITRHVEYAKALEAGSWNTAGHAAPVLTAPDTSPDSAIGYDREWRYDYDLKGQKIRDRRINAEYAEHAGNTDNTLATRYGDLSTEYQYDALGNLAQLTDASGASTFTWYDVLGRIRAVASPAGDGQLGLTTLDNDAFGNVTRQTRHAQGVSSVTSAGPAAPPGDSNDQVSVKRYDSHGHLLQEVNAEGGATYRSYDAMGRVAKQWQPATDADGRVKNAVRAYGYDRTGRQLSTTEFFGVWAQMVDKVSYNTFGEITQKGVNGYQEYFDYNAAGQLWRTNSEDGVDRVYLRDLQGTVTAEIRSQQRDLKYGFRTAAEVAVLRDNVMRTDTIVDLNERVVRQVLPTFSVERNIAVAPAPVFPPAALSVGVSSDAGYAAYADSAEWAGYNHVTLYWPSVAPWGDGNVHVQVDYTDPMTAWYDEYTGIRHIATKSIGREYASQTAAAGVQVSWHASETQGSIETVTRVTLYKRDATGQWVLLQQAIPSAAQMRYLAVPPMTALGGKVVVKLRPAGTTAWSVATLIDMGRQTLVDTSRLSAALTYDFEILHYRRDDSSGEYETLHYASATGQLGVSGNGWVSSTPTPATTDSVRHAPVIEQTLDRWGNVIGVSRPGDANAITRTRYDGLNNVLQQTAMPVDVWGEDGIATRSTPVMRQYYDLLGRLLGDTDANGNTESRRYDAAGNVIAEGHADGGTILHTYDLLGRKTSTTDAAGKTTRYTWDRMNRLKSEQRPIGADYYEYDQAGNRIRESGARVALTHWYDMRGRLVRTRNPLGGETSISYDMYGNKTYESNANGDWASWSHDAFGRLQSHTDFGGIVYTYGYNSGRQLTRQSSTGGQSLTQEYYANGALKRITDKALNAETYYEIDAAGNRTRERFTKAGIIHQDNRITFDNAGRIITVQDNRYTLTYGYDANGNRRFNRASYYDVAGVRQRIENWYQYDSMDRV